MTKTIALVVAVLVAALAFSGMRHHAAEPEARAHRVVFEVSNDDPAEWMKVLNNIDALSRALGPTQIEVVAHGGGLQMLTSAKSGPVRDRMQQSSDKGVVFAACQNTMRRMSVTKQDLVPFATTVDSGVSEVVRKQEAGWSYLRAVP